MMKHTILALTLIASSLLVSCGHKKSPPKPIPSPPPPISPRQSLAKQIRRHPKIRLMDGHVSGKHDSASARDNIISTANGGSARRSSYGRAPGGYVRLNTQMLKTMLYIANTKGWRYHVTEIAGGSHSSNSRHYSGVAFDVDRINGVKVGYGNPYYRRFMSICRARGATEVLGPGARGHSTHIHLAWPRS